MIGLEHTRMLEEYDTKGSFHSKEEHNKNLMQIWWWFAIANAIRAFLKMETLMAAYAAYAAVVQNGTVQRTGCIPAKFPHSFIPSLLLQHSTTTVQNWHPFTVPFEGYL